VDEAAKALGKAMALAPDDADSVQQRATIYHKSCNYTRALADFRAAIHLTTHARIDQLEICGHISPCLLAAEKVWRNRKSSGTEWPDSPGSTVNPSGAPWHDAKLGVCVQTSCIGVPGLVSLDLFDLLLANRRSMSASCQRQIFASVSVKGTVNFQ
jgi:hypothetical protein